MGEEITSSQFTDQDFERFHARLAEETAQLGEWLEQGRCSEREPVGGFEVEAWLVDKALEPAPVNVAFRQPARLPGACQVQCRAQ